MKKLLLGSAFFLLASASFSQGNEYALQNPVDQRIEVNRTFIQSSQFEPFLEANPISGMVISGEIIFYSDSSLVRVILVDNQYHEYLVYEAYPLLTDSTSFSINEIGEETALLNNVVPSKIIIEIIDATIFLEAIITSKADGYLKQASGSLRQQQMHSRINRINENLKKRNIPWVAGETSISQMSYEEKKAYFGGDLPNLYGFEYYTGGIFVMPGVLDTEDKKDYNSVKTDIGDSPYVKEFSWKDVHGQDWVTPVKNQGRCGSCWAFAAVGATEHLVNLYYNQHLDLDLSEQQIVSCSGAGSCRGGKPNVALNYIKNYGIVNEDCFPYRAQDISCTNQCLIPDEQIKIGGYSNFYPRTVNKLKNMVLNGPVSLALIPWRHAIALVGYKTLNSGDREYINSGWVTIDNNSPFIGKTAWLIKNSWGSWWGDGGYAYIIMDVTETYYTYGVNDPVTSPNFNTSDIVCTDNDNDGFYTWGIGPKPPHCPACPDEPDGDDSNACFGPRDEYGNLLSFTSPEPLAENVTIFEGQPVPDLTAEGTNIRWYSDYKLTNLIHSGISFTTGQSAQGIYTYYVTQTLSDCESVPKTVYLSILEGIKPPEAKDVEVCFGDQRIIKANGENIKWYSDVELQVLVFEGNNYTPEVTDPAIFTYYITQTIEGIESPSSQVKYTIKQPPGPINAEDKVFCSDEGLFMYAYGDSINWYTGEYSNELFDERNNRTYKIVTIGKQVWMAENLDIGEQIDGNVESSENGIIEKYYYNDDPSLGNEYGGLYQWQELMNYSTIEGSQGICPDGWHIPTNDEWNMLEMELGMSPDEVDVIGLRGTDHGLQLQEIGTSGFDAIMAGKRDPEGTFSSLEYFTSFWNSSGYNRTLSVHFDEVFASKSSYDTISNGFSVRCIMDESSYVVSGNRLDVSFYETGDYIFRVTNTNDGCESDPDTVMLTILDTPTPPTVGDYDYCLDEDIPILEALGENIKWYRDIPNSTFIDERDDNEYDIVQIDNQVWMAENLDYGTQLNGSSESTDNGIVEKYYYNDDTNNGSIYGGLYQWEELMDYQGEEYSQGICPDGWEVPSHKDWMKLEIALGMNQAEATIYNSRGTDQGAQLKEGGTSGFDALMAGKRTPEGDYAALEGYTTFWTSDAYNRTLGLNSDQVIASRSKYDPITNGFSVRCLMNDSSYSSIGNQIISSYNEPGVYNYSVTQTIEGCESDRAIVKLTLRNKPLSPISRALSVCEGDEIPIINVDGENIKWYADIGLDTLLHEGSEYNPLVLKFGINTFLVTQSDSYCESDPALISIEVKPRPEEPEAQDESVCLGDVIPSLIAEGNVIKWYEDPNLVESLQTGNEFATGMTDVGIYTYYATQTINGCESLSDTASLTINPIPPAPDTRNTAICEGIQIPELIVVGEDIKWYSDSVLSQLLHSGNSFEQTQVDIGYYPYYVTNTVNGCESSSTAASLTIKDTPEAPMASNVSVCDGDTLPELIAFGGSIKWYNDIGLVNLIQLDSALKLDIDIPGIYTYYATQTIDGCESSPQNVELLIKELPSAPIAADVQVCEGEKIPILNATGDNIRWYDNLALDKIINLGNQLDTLPILPGTYLFYVTQTHEGCEGHPGEVELELKELPEISLGQDTVIKDNEELILGPYPIEYSYLWSTTTIDPFLKIIGKDYNIGEHEISVQVSYNGCVFKDTIIITVESTIGIDGLITNEHLKVYPNPTEGNITVEFIQDISDNAVIEIFDARGALIKKYRRMDLRLDSDHAVKIHLETTGLFYLRIYNIDQIFNCKIIRQ